MQRSNTSRQSSIPRPAGRNQSQQPAPTRMAPRPTQVGQRKLPDNSTACPNDQELIEQLQLIFAGEDMISPQELKSPKISRRLFTPSGVVSTLITNASFVSLPDAHSQIFSIAQRYFCDVRLHPKFATTTAFAGAVEYFLTLYDIGTRQWNFSVKDIFQPEPHKVRRLLWALVGIVGCTSKYETRLQESYLAIKEAQNQLSNLWDDEVDVKALEHQQEQKEAMEASPCEIARENLLQRQKEQLQIEGKSSSLRETSEKTFKLKEEKQNILNAAREEKKILSAKITALEEQIVADPNTLLRRLEATREAKEKIDTDLKEQDEKRKKLMRQNELLNTSVSDAEVIHEKFLKSKKNDHARFVILDRELRAKLRALSIITDDVANTQSNFEKATAKLEELKISQKKKEEELKTSRVNQQRLQRELERDNASLEEQCKGLALRQDKLQRETLHFQSTLNALEQNRQQLLDEYTQQVATLKTDCLADCTAVRARKLDADGKVAALKQYFEDEMGRKWEHPCRTTSDSLPLTARQLYTKSQTILFLRQKKPQTWLMPAAAETSPERGSAA